MLADRKVLITIGVAARLVQYTAAVTLVCFVSLGLFISVVGRGFVSPDRPDPDLTASPGDGTFLIFNAERFFMSDDGGLQLLLKRVTGYYVQDDKFYVTSDEGFAVANLDTNQCRIYILEPERFKDWYSSDHRSRFIAHENILYLNSFFEFSDEEQIMLRYLQE